MLGKLIEFHLILHIAVLFFVLALGAQTLDNIPRVDDDGSQTRHLHVSMLTSAVASSVIPFSGYYLTVGFGDAREGNNYSLDSENDKQWNRMGAAVGNRYGTGAWGGMVLFWMMLTFVYKTKRLRFIKKRKLIPRDNWE